jgi:hypothetical protein
MERIHTVAEAPGDCTAVKERYLPSGEKESGITLLRSPIEVVRRGCLDLRPDIRVPCLEHLY